MIYNLATCAKYQRGIGNTIEIPKSDHAIQFLKRQGAAIERGHWSRKRCTGLKKGGTSARSHSKRLGMNIYRTHSLFVYSVL